MDAMLEQRLCALECENRWWRRMVAVGVLALLVLAQPGTRAVVAQSTAATLEQRVATLESKLKSQALRLAALESKLVHWTRSGNDLYITGANLHLRSGQGATNGNPEDPQSTDPALTRTNGLGNLIVGYNELRGGELNVRYGSHTLVVGAYNYYASYGGLVVGRHSTVFGPYAVVSGGERNTASGSFAAVSGGAFNTAAGPWDAVSGGSFNTARGNTAVVSGGQSNTASGVGAAVSGGRSNQAIGPHSSASGGTGIRQSGNDGWSAGTYTGTGFGLYQGRFRSP